MMVAVKLLQRSVPRTAAPSLRRVLLALAGLLVGLCVVGTVYLLTLQGVGNARARADRIMRSHHESTAVLPTPGRLVASVVSVEDEHFYDNVAINVATGAGRAALAALRTSQDPGGSTIDQQLANELYGHGHGVGATLREIGLGVKLALHYSKQQILQMYLNVAYYGNGYWGVTQAAEGYFHTSPARLTWAQASMLAGLLQAPAAYDPVAHYALARGRQRHVLDQLVVNHHLSPQQARAVFAAGLPLAR